MVKQTADAFRNRITIIGTISQRIARLAKDPALAQDAEILYREIQSLEPHLERFEKDVEI
jgi:ribosomal protein S15P/S13E